MLTINLGTAGELRKELTRRGWGNRRTCDGAEPFVAVIERKPDGSPRRWRTNLAPVEMVRFLAWRRKHADPEARKARMKDKLIRRAKALRQRAQVPARDLTRERAKARPANSVLLADSWAGSRIF